MRLAVASLILLSAFALPLSAEICTIDDVPAATLLLPYFEVDLDDAWGMHTLFTINNASASAAVAHVTLWTDQSMPTLDFDVYLTGYDVQTITVRDIFNGILPRTADRGADAATDGVSPSPPAGAVQAANVNPFTGPFTPGVPTEFDFGGSSGPCVQAYTNPVLDAARIAGLRAAHTGKNAALYGGCMGADYGDNHARGYITVDVVTQCNLLFPSSAGYFSTGIADTRNILWGDYFYVDEMFNTAEGESLVHIESCASNGRQGGYSGVNGGATGTGAGQCPFEPGDYTFYGRYSSVAGQDQREPLATTFAARYVNGGAFDGGTSLIVWRDAKTIPIGVNGPYTCGTGGPAWFPLNQSDVVAFDEQENPTDLCFAGDVVSPPLGGALTCFPLEAQRVPVGGGSPVGADLAPPADFGWLYLNLNTAVAGVDYPEDPSIAQAWVTTVASAEGRFSVGWDAIKLDSACYPTNQVFLGGPPT